MNPLKIFEYDPLDRTNLSFPAKVLVWFIEYIARILGAIYLSIALLIVSVWPKRSASKTFFRMIGSVADMYRMKWMPDEFNVNEAKTNGTNNGPKTMDKRNEQKVSGLESKK